MFKEILNSETKPHVVILFGLVVTGILAKWFWGLGWVFLQDPAAGLPLGSWQTLLVRFVLALIAAGLTFVPTYNKIGQNTGESWVLAFQNGFFWESALDAVL